MAAVVDSDAEVEQAALTRFADEGFAFAARVKLQPRQDASAAAAAASATPRVPPSAR